MGNVLNVQGNWLADVPPCGLLRCDYERVTETKGLHFRRSPCRAQLRGIETCPWSQDTPFVDKDMETWYARAAKLTSFRILWRNPWMILNAVSDALWSHKPGRNALTQFNPSVWDLHDSTLRVLPRDQPNSTSFGEEVEPQNAVEIRMVFKSLAFFSSLCCSTETKTMQNLLTAKSYQVYSVYFWSFVK